MYEKLLSHLLYYMCSKIIVQILECPTPNYPDITQLFVRPSRVMRLEMMCSSCQGNSYHAVKLPANFFYLS